MQRIYNQEIPLGYQQITLAGSTALTLPSVPAGASYSLVKAIIQVEAQAVRMRDDGVAPTTTVGFLLPVGTIFELEGRLDAYRFVEATAGAILNVLYYGIR